MSRSYREVLERYSTLIVRTWAMLVALAAMFFLVAVVVYVIRALGNH